MRWIALVLIGLLLTAPAMAAPNHTVAYIQEGSSDPEFREYARDEGQTATEDPAAYATNADPDTAFKAASETESQQCYATHFFAGDANGQLNDAAGAPMVCGEREDQETFDSDEAREAAGKDFQETRDKGNDLIGRAEALVDRTVDKAIDLVFDILFG